MKTLATKRLATFTCAFVLVVSCAPTTFAQQGLDVLLTQAEKEEPAAPRPAAVQAPAPAAAPAPDLPVEAEPAAPRPVPVRRLPVPLADAVKPALAQVKEIFGDDYAAANSPEKKVDLARRFLQQAGSTPNSVERWALLSEAMRLAADAGSMEVAFEAIDTSAAQYDVNADDLRLDAITKLGAKAKPALIDELARTAVGIAKKAVGSGDAQLAQKSLALASGFARKTKNTATVAEINRIQQSIRDEEKDAKERALVMDKLAANPDDPEVCLDAGKYYCFKADDWAKGLPLLAKGADAGLAKVAALELAARKSAGSPLAVADAWWDWAEDQKAALRSAGMAHAADLYQTVLEKAQGLERARLEKRIKQASSEAPGPRGGGRRMPLAEIQPQQVSDVMYGYENNGTMKGAPYTCLGQAWPNGISSHVIGDARPSSIVYALPRGAKRIVGKAGVVTPKGIAPGGSNPVSPQNFEILVDGRSVWKSPPLTKREETADFDVALFGGSRMELRVTSGSSGNAWTAWLNPELVY
jgi:hypothetical protein